MKRMRTSMPEKSRRLSKLPHAGGKMQNPKLSIIQEEAIEVEMSNFSNLHKLSEKSEELS